MAWAFALSRELGLCPDGDAERVARHMAAMGLPLPPPLVDGQPPAADTLFAHMQQDKKVVEGQIVLILARGIGQAFVARDIDVETLKSFLQRTVQSSC